MSPSGGLWAASAPQWPKNDRFRDGEMLDPAKCSEPVSRSGTVLLDVDCGHGFRTALPRRPRGRLCVVDPRWDVGRLHYCQDFAIVEV